MTREELRDAGQLLEHATHEMADEHTGERAAGLADQLETLAEADRGPDHGRIARLENVLNEIEAECDGEASEAVSEAHERVTAYRSTVEGV